MNSTTATARTVKVMAMWFMRFLELPDATIDGGTVPAPTADALLRRG
jgi:hypothetical protein